MKVANEKTVFCTLAKDGSKYVELLTLDGVSLTLDTGSLMTPNQTVILINGVSYLPFGTSVEIVNGDEGANIVTTIAVTTRGA